MDKDLLFDRKPRSTQNAYVALLHFVHCDTTDSSCNEGLMDNDFSFVDCNGGLMDKDLLFAEEPRSTENMYMVVQQFTDCNSIDSG